jgi:hypothetical protein
MAERRIINGYIVERGDDGQIRTIGPANTAPQMPADPGFQYEGPKAAAEVQGSQLDNRYKQIQIQEATEGKLPVGYRRTADGGAELIPGVPLPGAKKGDAPSPQAVRAAKQLLSRLQSQNKLFMENFSGSGFGAIGEYNPFSGAVQEFNDYSTQMLPFAKQLSRSPGEGAQSDRDAMDYRALLPENSERDQTNINRMTNLRDAALEVLRSAGEDVSAYEGFTPGVANGAASVQPNNGPTILPRAAGAQADPGIGPTGVTSEGGLRYEQGLAGLPDAVANMVGQGAQPSEITAFLNQQYAPFGASVGPDMAAAIGTLVQRHRADPRAPVKSLNTGWENFSMLPGRQESTMLGRAADTDVGNFVMHAANAATAGIPGYLAGDQGAAVLDASRQSRPLSSLGGDVTGSIAAMAGINAGAGALGRAGSLLTRGGGIGGDVAYGATRGGLENGPMGALTGAAAAGIGNRVGSGIANTAGRVTRGVSDPAVNYLSERGIPLTLGQLLGNRGMTGKVLNRLESAPGIGDMMAARRLESMEGFNREAMRQAVKPVGGNVTTAGREGLDQAYGAVDQGYADALSGQQFSGNEPQFINEMGAAIQRGQAVPKLGEDFAYIMREDVAPMFDANGVLTGDRLQAALQGLRKARSGFAGQPMGQYAGDALTDAERAITGMVSRQAPDVMPRLSAANKAYGNVSTIGDAVNTAVNQGGIFTPAQLGRSAVNNTKKFGGKRAAATGNVPFRELQEAGQEVLPSTVPDSGTAGRAASLLLPAALGGSAVGGEALNAPPAVTVPLAVLAALSSKTGARAAQKALTGRGDTAKKIGNALIRQKRRAGLFGAATTGAMVPQFSQ